MRPLSMTTAASGIGAEPVPSMRVASNDGEGRAAGAGNAFGDIGQRAHAIRARLGDEIAQRAFIAFADGFKMVKFGVG